MDAGDGTPLDIVVVAASSARRHHLAKTALRAARARIRSTAGISLEREFQAHADLFIIDVDGPALASTIIHMTDALPEGTGVIALADDPNPQWVRKALQARVNAVLSRDVIGEELRLAILAADAGLVLLHPSSAQSLSQGLAPIADPPVPVEALTAREQQVLRLVSEGLGNKEIATRLNISGHTVKFHISSVLGKLGATSRTEAVSQGIRRGLIAI